MVDSIIIDTFDSFLRYWTTVKDKNINDQIDSWISNYLVEWPDLARQSIQSYEEENYKWRKIAEEKVFPFISDRIPRMEETRNNLLRCINPIYT